jgi:predicted Fe-S protein YdhL (DUF1289 family)
MFVRKAYLHRMMLSNKNKSPCIKQCRLNENKVCVGCGRSIDEIKQYGNENKAA